MKKSLLVLLSVLLIAASIFGLFAGYKGVKEVMNVMEYKQDQADAGYYAILHNDERIKDRSTYPELDEQDADNPSMLGGIDQLRENMDAYVEGVPEYEAGLVQLEDGKLQLAAGQLKLNQGYADYAAGQQQLADGKKTLDDGEAQYAAALEQYNAGVKLIEENTQAYNEGKAKLAQIEPLMPYVNAYVNFRNGVVNSLPGFGQTVFYNAQAWFAQIVMPLASSLGLSLPGNVTDLPAAVQQMVADGKAQLKEYEDGLAMLEAAKPQLEAARKQLDDGHVAYNEGQAALADGAAQLRAGEAQLADGKAQLADGEKQLAEGKSQLELFEAGEDALVAGALQLIAQPAYRTGDVGAIPTTDSDTKGKVACVSVAEMLAEEKFLGSDFDPNDPESCLWQKDENGNYIVLHDHKLINLDAVEKVAKAGQEYIEVRQGSAVQSELIGRIVTYLLLAVASVFGILAGLCGLIGAGKGKVGAAVVLGWIATIAGVAGLVWGIIKGAFGGYAFFPAVDPSPYVKGTGAEAIKYAEGTYHLAPMIALLCLAVLGVLFVLVAGAAKKAYKRSKAPVETAAYTAAAPVAVPVAEPVTVEAPVAKTVVLEEPAVRVAEPVVQVVTPAESAAAAQAAAAAAMAAATPKVIVKTAADWAKEAQDAADEAQALAAAGDYEAVKAAARRAAAGAEEAVKAANAQ